MCIVSFEKALNITVHNQYPSLELTSPVYFSDGTTYCVYPNQQTYTGNIMETSFGIDFRQKDLKCVSLYKLQRKRATKTDNQPDNSIASMENTEANMYLLVAWVAKDYEHTFCVCLVEFTDDFVWDEDKLWALYNDYNDQFHIGNESRIITRFLHGGKVMRIRYEATYGSDYKLDIVISEGNREDDTEDPIKIDLKRLVLSSPMSIMLIYVVRLTIRPSFKLNIHNQCLNVDLVSPTYITGEEFECHKPPNYNVCAENIMKSAFIIKWDNESYGALMYRLQRKQTHEHTESNEDTSSAIHLLAVWEISGSKKLCTDVLLVEHDKGFDWEKDSLEELYCKNSNRFRLYSGSVTETWSLGDNTALMITFEIMNRGRILDIAISEVERNNNTKAPAHIDLEG
jgi:hypothetical protein